MLVCFQSLTTMEKIHSKQELKTVNWRSLNTLLLLLQYRLCLFFFMYRSSSGRVVMPRRPPPRFHMIWSRTDVGANARRRWRHDLTCTLLPWIPSKGCSEFLYIHKIFSFGRLRSTVTNGITTLDQNITHILYKEFSREFSYKKKKTKREKLNRPTNEIYRIYCIITEFAAVRLLNRSSSSFLTLLSLWIHH